MKVQLTGSANLWLATRSASKLGSTSAVVIISKEQGSSRKFIGFGKFDSENRKVSLQKKQEIPKIDSISVGCDLNEIAVEFTDNGDNRIFVSVTSELNKKQSFEARFYGEEVESTSLFVGGEWLTSDS